MCRWAFPFVQGGIPMHNVNLLNSVNNYLDVSLISEDNVLNESYYLEMGIPFNAFRSYQKYFYGTLMRLGLLKNGLRSFSDWYNSFIINTTLSNHPHDLVEFMDIHSEGFVYNKNNPKGVRKTIVIIRSHTPWTILRKYYSDYERKGVDAWWAIDREQYCFNNCDAITTPSHDLKNELINTFNIDEEKITVLPNLVDTNHFTPRYYSDNEIFTILHVGRFEKGKGVETLLDAFILLAKKYPNVHLLNIGPEQGAYLEKCKNRLSNENLLDRVTFAGFISYERLPEKYGIADLVVVPSEIYESFSYTVAQAMACGRSVIASKIGGIPETLGDGNNGLSFKPGNTEELFEKINELYIDEKKRIFLGSNARDYAVNNFSIEVLAPKYIEYYRSLLN